MPCRTLRKSLAGKVLLTCFHVPGGQCGLHLGIGGPEVFLLGHHQKAQTAPQLLLCLCVELSAELFHGLAPHLEVLVKVDVVGLQPQVEVPLFGKIVAGDQVLGQRYP